MKNPTNVERTSDRELVVTRTFDAPVRLVYEAWTRAELFQRWWAPKSLGMQILSCEMDVRTGGGYRLTFGAEGSEGFTFHGRYIEVVPLAKMVWTNEESEGGSVTTVTFEEKDGGTLLVLHELYPTKEALEESAGAEEAMPEQFAQLDELLVALTG
jgi:uncharacterized protein YndB with AHSA1/START domain